MRSKVNVGRSDSVKKEGLTHATISGLLSNKLG